MDGEVTDERVGRRAGEAEALERAKQGAFGTQVQALEAAKGLGADLNQKALDAVDKAEKDAK